MEPVYTLLLLAAVPCSAVLCGHVPAPDNIEMNSRNFVHLLTWEVGPGSPAGVSYRVTYRSYNDGWRTVESCAQVRYPLLCNLTDVFSDVDKMYYINVTAVLGKNTSTPRSYHTPFRPVSDTEPEPPSLRLSPCNDSLCVYLQSPSQRLQKVYEKLDYTLNVTNEKGPPVRSFNAPYKVQLLWPAVESLTCVSLELDTHKNVQVNKDADHEEEEEEEEEEEVMYERLGGCQDASCEEVLEETSSSLSSSPENQFKLNHMPGTETRSDVIIPHREATPPQHGSPIFKTHSIALTTPIPQLKKNPPSLIWSTRGDRHGLEEDKDSDDVNFFSLTLGGQNFVQQEKAKEEEQTENVKLEKNLFVLETRKPFLVQPSSSGSTRRHVSYSEDDEEEDTDEADAFSGYMMRN
ncbi:Interferon alpha/beta receptor 2 [Bagarius yarrelli]|uniref:Interferon alpha/beta receptor 2 n=1 Tax=Bagarius yarrelli TaxID=175774 RepID=A0A556U4K2_BAGYA|nr:Interferon alpha/beta receptor 2 [Bagarius yarrelli]